MNGPAVKVVVQQEVRPGPQHQAIIDIRISGILVGKDEIFPIADVSVKLYEPRVEEPGREVLKVLKRVMTKLGAMTDTPEPTESGIVLAGADVLAQLKPNGGG